MWTIWDKQSEINGFSAEWYLSRNPHLRDEETICLKTVEGKVVYVAGKGVLASVYGIDPALPDEEFIAAYEAKLAELNAPADEPTEPEDTDTTTYAELAQVYKEGVNSIE